MWLEKNTKWKFELAFLYFTAQIQNLPISADEVDNPDVLLRCIGFAHAYVSLFLSMIS